MNSEPDEKISKAEAKAWAKDCAQFADWYENEGKHLPPPKEKSLLTF